MRFIPQHVVVQKYGVILPDYLTTQVMKESEAYKTYHALATGNVQPKPKYVRRSSRTKTDDVPKPSSGKRVKATAKVAKSGKKKQPAIGLDTLSDIALTEAEQLKLATKRSLTQTHISQPSGSGAHEGTGVKPGVPDVPTYRSDDEEEIPWKSSDEDDNDDNEDDDDDQGVPDDDQGVPYDDQGDDNDSERIVSDTEGDDFVHPKFTSHDTEERHDEEDKDKESFDPRVQTPSHYEPSDDEANDDLAQSGYAEEEEVNVEQTFEANINLEGRDAEMTDAPKTTQVIEDTHVTLTPVNPEGQQQSSSVSSGFISNMLNPNPDTGIDSVLNVETTSLVDVPVTSQATTTLPQPSNPLIPHVQQTPTPTLATTPTLVDAYATDKDLQDAYGDTVTIKRRRDEADDDQEPSAKTDQGSKRRRAGKEPESSSAPKETTSKSTGKSTEMSESRHHSAGQFAPAEEPIHTEDDFKEPTH
ncbi:hypothetical protein Tco_1533541 [Tanacetum coccineum]